MVTIDAVMTVPSKAITCTCNRQPQPWGTELPTTLHNLTLYYGTGIKLNSSTIAQAAFGHCL